MIWAKWYEFHLAMSKEHSITSTITMITNLANQNNVQWYSLTFSHSTRVTRQAFSLGSHFTHTHTPRKLDLPVQTKPKHNTLLSLLHTSLFVHHQDSSPILCFQYCQCWLWWWNFFDWPQWYLSPWTKRGRQRKHLWSSSYDMCWNCSPHSGYSPWQPLSS